MIIVFFFMSLILSCLPLSHSATDRNITTPICPESFSCPALPLFKYPFYNVRDTRCGLIKVSCTSTGAEIQLRGRSYVILGNIYSHNISSLLYIKSITLKQLLENKSCEALMDNFTSPSPNPLLYSISIASFITIFKCTKNLTYFEQHKYKSYNGCKGHNFYYNYGNGTVPSDLPHTCQAVQLPVQTPSSSGFDETNIFSLISSGTTVFVNLTRSCSECKKKGRLCEINNGHDVQCFAFKKEKPGTKLSRDVRIKILVIAGSALILILSLAVYIIWRLCKSNRFSYVSSKNKSPNTEDISLFYGVSVFSYNELEDATQNFDPSQELGDGGFGAVYYGKLKDGREVAVKKLHEHNYNRVQQFRNEVEILTKLRHPNLVVLYGCTSRQGRELLLVYEYVPNGETKLIS